MGLGGVALQHLLVRKLDLGNQPVGVSAQPAIPAHAGDGSRQSPLFMVQLWTAVGPCRADQYFHDCVASFLRMLARLPVAPSRQALPSAGGI